MNNAYHDIRSNIEERPYWWDEHAVPRYIVFSPRHCASIYAKEAALVRIACQRCATEFDVCFSHDGGHAHLATSIVDGSIHYGDPPNIECCPAGPTMNSIPKRVLQYWKQAASFVWERMPALEI